MLKEKHPEIKLVSSAGPGPDDERFTFAWPKLRELKADIVDEHCYAKPEWFFDAATRYDKYDRNGPKVFMGEYAAQSLNTVNPNNRNNWECALSEAAFMTGLERNADVVVMSSYAPLFAHMDAWQWTPDLIWCDNLSVYGTPSYYVQQLFSRNRGDVVLPVKIGGDAIGGQEAGLVCHRKPRRKGGRSDPESGQCRGRSGGNDGADSTAREKSPATAKITVLAGANLADENSFAEPKKVAPVTSDIEGVGPEFKYTFKPRSLTVLRIATEE